MVNQYIWIGITIGVFIAGLGIGASIFTSDTDPTTNMIQNRQMFNQMMSQNPQSMGWMMEDPKLREQMFEQMNQNPSYMRNWMVNDPEHLNQMSQIMREDHQFMSNMMATMMNDPELRIQMIGHMSENQEAFQQMMSMMGSGNMMGNMSGISPGMTHP